MDSVSIILFPATSIPWMFNLGNLATKTNEPVTSAKTKITRNIFPCRARRLFFFNSKMRGEFKTCFLRMALFYIFPAAHIWPESLGNFNGSVRLLAVLYDLADKPGHGESGIVERVRELHLAILVFVAY